jgi:iron complex transport system substrate-binding protein
MAAARMRACVHAPLLLYLLLLLLLALAFPALPARADAVPAISVIDDSGQPVTLARPAQRVISLSPGITELLFTVGAGPRVVGVSEFSDFPTQALQLPRVSRAQGIDLERIAQLAPDLIVAWGSGYAPALLDGVRRLKVPVYIHEPRSLEAIARSVERLGALTGSVQAADVAARFRARVEDLRARYGARTPVRVFYQVWPRPIMTLSGQHVVSEVIRLCGGRNVFEKLAPLAATVDVESVIAAQPQLIITAEAGGKDTGALQIWRRYPQVPAVAHGRLVTLNADALDRSSTRIVDAAQMLCEAVQKARDDASIAPPEAPHH